MCESLLSSAKFPNFENALIMAPKIYSLYAFSVINKANQLTSQE